MNFEDKYPFISSWVQDGEIQIGRTESYHWSAAVVDHGGVIWEKEEPFDSVDDLLDEMEKAIEAWCHENGIELIDRHGRSLLDPDEE